MTTSMNIKLLVAALLYAGVMSLGTGGSAIADDVRAGGCPQGPPCPKDSYITTKVKAELAKSSSNTVSHIHVTTKDGVVMLKGNVNSDLEKQKAEKDASGVKGVSHVENNLTVKAQ
jgi:hyperosmotically inducible protein